MTSWMETFQLCTKPKQLSVKLSRTRTPKRSLVHKRVPLASPAWFVKRYQPRSNMYTCHNKQYHSVDVSWQVTSTYYPSSFVFCLCVFILFSINQPLTIFIHRIKISTVWLLTPQCMVLCVCCMLAPHSNWVENSLLLCVIVIHLGCIVP